MKPAKTKEKLGASYWKLWSATGISNLGDGVAAVAYPWLASAVTRSPFLIALSVVVSRLPWLVFTLFAGVLTDRFNRKRIIVTTAEVFHVDAQGQQTLCAVMQQTLVPVAQTY